MKLKDYEVKLRNDIAHYSTRLKLDGYSDLRIFIFKIECYVIGHISYFRGYLKGFTVGFLKALSN